MSTPLHIRPARPSDATPVADLYLAARRLHLAYAPMAHTEADVRQWMAQQVLKGSHVWIAEAGASNEPLGFCAASLTSAPQQAAWIDQLFVRPGHERRGIGRDLLHHALGLLPRPVRLYTFQANTGARRFCERHGFVAIAFGDGSDNEERCPDVLLERAG